MLKSMMIFLFVLAIAAGVSAKTIGPGDDAPALEVGKWLRGPEINLVPLSPPAKGDGLTSAPALKIIVIWGSWSPAATASLNILQSLKTKYPTLEILAICRERETALQDLLNRGENPSFSIVLDKNDQTTTRYMVGEVIFPKAFVVDDKRKVMWSGEVADLSDAVREIMEGRYNLDRAIKLHPLRNELITALQFGDDKRILRSSGKILEQSPADNFALRARMFVYENSGDTAAAVKFITGQIKLAPKQSKLYFLQLELLLRTPESEAELQQMLVAVSSRFENNPVVLNELSWFILERIPFAQTPVELLLKITDTALKKLPSDAMAAEKISCLTARARALFFIGDTAQAVELQRQAVALSTNIPELQLRVSAVLKTMESALKLHRETLKK